MATGSNRQDFNEDELYEQFPHGAEQGVGPDEGFNTWVRINDPELFTPEARENPAIREFLAAPFTVNFAQFKSSHRESEYFVHKPDLVMSGRLPGVIGNIPNMPPDPRIATLVLNHELTLAKHIMRSVTIEDGKVAGQVIHKEPEPPEEAGPDTAG
jgi:hypothetical protein